LGAMRRPEIAAPVITMIEIPRFQRINCLHRAHLTEPEATATVHRFLFA
jgi:hypothetical protein